jgi:hypothetical protein
VEEAQLSGSEFLSKKKKREGLMKKTFLLSMVTMAVFILFAGLGVGGVPGLTCLLPPRHGVRRHLRQWAAVIRDTAREPIEATVKIGGAVGSVTKSGIVLLMMGTRKG